MWELHTTCQNTQDLWWLLKNSIINLLVVWVRECLCCTYSVVCVYRLALLHMRGCVVHENESLCVSVLMPYDSSLLTLINCSSRWPITAAVQQILSHMVFSRLHSVPNCPKKSKLFFNSEIKYMFTIKEAYSSHFMNALHFECTVFLNTLINRAKKKVSCH